MLLNRASTQVVDFNENKINYLSNANVLLIHLFQSVTPDPFDTLSFS